MSSRGKEATSAVLAVVAGIALILCWHLLNHAFPNGDEAEYLGFSLGIFRKFTHEGLIAGFHEMYRNRLWKPILHPVLMVPALFLSGGNVLSGQMIGALYLYALLSLSTYLIARRFLSRLDAVLVSAVLLNVQWMMLPAHAVKSELSFVGFFFATWAFLFRSEGFVRPISTVIAAVFLGLAACVRPAEAVLSFSILIPVFAVTVLQRDRRVSELRQALSIVAVAVVPYVLFLIFFDRFSWSRDWDSNLRFAEVVLAVSWVLYFALVRKRAKTLLPLFLLVSASIAELWFAPSSQSLLGWVQYTSFAEGPHQLPQRFGFSALFSKLSEAYLGAGWGVLVFAALAVCAHSLRNGAGRKLQALGLCLAALLGVSAVHLTLGARSFNGDIRYYLVEVAGIYLCVLMLLFQAGPALIARRCAMVAVWAVLSLSQLAAYGYTGFPAGYFLRFQPAFGGMGADAPWRGAEPGLEAFDRISSRLGPGFRPNVLVYPVKNPEGFPRFMEPFTLRLIALSKGYDIDAAFPRPALYVEWKSWHDRDWRQFDYYLVGPIGPIGNEKDSPILTEIRGSGDEDISTFRISASDRPITFAWVATHRQEK